MPDDNEPSVDCVHVDMVEDEAEEGTQKKDDQEMNPVLFSNVREDKTTPDNNGPLDGVRVESEVEEGASGKKEDRLEKDSSPSKGKKDNVTKARHGDQAKPKGCACAPTKEDTESEKKIKEELDNDNIGNYLNLTLMVSNATQLRELFDKEPNEHHSQLFYVLDLSLLFLSVFLQLCSAFLRLCACGTCNDKEKGLPEDDVKLRPKGNSTVLGLLALLTLLANIIVAGSPTPDDHLRLFNSNVTSQTFKL